MAEEIRGLSIKFDADFSSFKKGMNSADKDIKSTQTQLKNLQSSLNLKWDPKKFSQAQEQAQKALEATEQKASLLRDRLAAMESVGVTDKTRNEYNYLAEQLSRTELNAEQLRQQLENLDGIRLKNLTAGIDEATEKLNKASEETKGISVTAGAAATGLVAAGLNAIESADEVATLATQYKMSTDAIQEFNYVAQQTDSSAEEMYKGVYKVKTVLSSLASGEATAATEAMTKLGISYNSLKSSDEQFYDVIEALSNLGDETERVTYMNAIFGEDASVKLLPLLYAGSSAIKEYRDEFSELGSLTEDQVLGLASLDGELDKLKTQYSNVAIQLGASLLPMFQSFSDFASKEVLPILRDLVNWFSSLDEGQQKTLMSLLLLLAGLSPALKLFSSVSGGISSLIQWLGKLDKATLITYGKWFLLLTAVGTLFNVLANWSNMNTTQKIVGLLGSLAAAALAAALAFGAFHSAWSVGLAIAGIVAGIAAATAAVKEAGKEIGAEVSFDQNSFSSSVSIPQYDIPSESSAAGGQTTNNTSNYVDNSNIVINIEKNEYMTDDDIIRAVNKGLKQAKQSRT